MRSEVVLTAVRREVRGCPETVLTQMWGTGQLVPRRTGVGRVHLTGAAAGPLDGDEVLLRVHVGEGAALRLRSTAAALALPGRPGAPPSRLVVRAEVDDGGLLDLRPEPTVVAGAAHLGVELGAVVRGTGRLVALEQVVLGRHGEPGGRWCSRTVVDRAGCDGRRVAWLRQSVDDRLLTAVPGSAAVRCLVSWLDTGDGRGPDAAVGPAGPGPGRTGEPGKPGVSGTRCEPAGGGLVATAWGDDLAGVARTAARLAGR